MQDSIKMILSCIAEDIFFSNESPCNWEPFSDYRSNNFITSTNQQRNHCAHFSNTITNRCITVTDHCKLSSQCLSLWTIPNKANFIDNSLSTSSLNQDPDLHPTPTLLSIPELKQQRHSSTPYTSLGAYSTAACYRDWEKRTFRQLAQRLHPNKHSTNDI